MEKQYQFNLNNMATIKSFTSLEQSKKLAEILPLESADMVLLHEEPYETSDSMFDGLHQALCVPFSKYDKSWRQKYKNISYFPCWSLASLLGVLPQSITKYIKSERCQKTFHLNLFRSYYHCVSYSSISSVSDDDTLYCIGRNNWVDACVAMIEKLHELNIL